MSVLHRAEASHELVKDQLRIGFEDFSDLSLQLFIGWDVVGFWAHGVIVNGMA